MNTKNSLRPFAVALICITLLAGCERPVGAAEESQMEFQRVPLQFIAALVDPATWLILPPG